MLSMVLVTHESTICCLSKEREILIPDSNPQLDSYGQPSQSVNIILSFGTWAAFSTVHMLDADTLGERLSAPILCHSLSFLHCSCMASNLCWWLRDKSLVKEITHAPIFCSNGDCWNSDEKSLEPSDSLSFNYSFPSESLLTTLGLRLN